MKTNILIQGLTCTGKTRCIATLLPEYYDESGAICKGAGIEPFALSMEPGLAATLGRNLCGHPDAPSPCIHWHYIQPGAIDRNTLRKFALLSQVVDSDTLSKQQDPNRGQYTQYLDMFDVCAKFICHGCNQDFGDVGKWGEDRAICQDGLTGLTKVARRHVCGSSPFLSLPKIGQIQDLIEAWMDIEWGGTKCHSILLGHLEREVSPLTGVPIVTLSTIGQKLAPKLLMKPDEVITTYINDKGKYLWDTTQENGQPKKHRRLPESANLAPDFSQLFR